MVEGEGEKELAVVVEGKGGVLAVVEGEVEKLVGLDYFNLGRTEKMSFWMSYP